MRLSFALLLLAGLLVAAPLPRATARGNNGSDEMRIRAGKAADALLAAWRAEHDEAKGDVEKGGFAKAVRARAPDRFRVVLELALRAKGVEERKAVLAAFADERARHAELGTSPLIETARRYAAATETEITTERARAGLFKRVEGGLIDQSMGGPAALIALAPKEAVPAWSIAAPVNDWLRYRIYAASSPSEARVELQHALLKVARARGWTHMAFDVHMLTARFLQKHKQRPAAAWHYGTAARYARKLGLASDERTGLQYAVVLSMNTGDLVQRYAYQIRLAELMEKHAPANVSRRMQLWLLDAEIRLNDLTQAWSAPTRCSRRRPPPTTRASRSTRSRSCFALDSGRGACSTRSSSARGSPPHARPRTTSTTARAPRPRSVRSTPRSVGTRTRSSSSRRRSPKRPPVVASR